MHNVTTAQVHFAVLTRREVMSLRGFHDYSAVANNAWDCWRWGGERRYGHGQYYPVSHVLVSFERKLIVGVEKRGHWTS